MSDVIWSEHMIIPGEKIGDAILRSVDFVRGTVLFEYPQSQTCFPVYAETHLEPFRAWLDLDHIRHIRALQVVDAQTRASMKRMGFAKVSKETVKRLQAQARAI